MRINDLLLNLRGHLCSFCNMQSVNNSGATLYRIMKKESSINEKIASVVRNRFGLDLREHFVNMEISWRQDDPDRYDRIRERFREHFKMHPNRESVKKRFYIDDEFSIYLQSWHKYSEIPKMTDDISRYYPICQLDEINRIRPPKNASDYLLAMMANAIADNSRIKRIFLRRWEADPKNWSLSGYFDRSAFDEYTEKLPNDKLEICRGIPAHFGFLSEPNGACIRSSYGKVIVVSEVLKVYLYYMNLCLLKALTDDFPEAEAFGALFIAVRTMLLLETPDFDLDPRGKLPPDLHALCTFMAETQLQFVIGHEYAHALLGHLDDFSAYRATAMLIPSQSGESRDYYAPEHEQEFAADASSLLQIKLPPKMRAQMANGATWFFLGLDLLQAATKVLRPDMANEDTHPAPISRIRRLRGEILADKNSSKIKKAGLYSEDEVAYWIERTNDIKKAMLEEWIPKHLESLRVYGSTYLPVSRGPALVDRFDY